MREKKIKELHFIFGGIIALLGSFIFVLNGANKSSSSSDFLTGILLLAGTVIIQAIQSFVVKDTAKHIHSMVISSCSSILTSILFFTISIFSGNITELLSASADKIVIVLLTGMYSIFVGMVMTFFIIQKQGVVVLNVLKLTIPPATAIIGYLFLHEKISLIQGLGAALVLVGCIVALRRKK